MDLRSYLDQSGIDYDWSSHTPAFTAQTLAEAEHVSGNRVIKPVIVETDGEFVMCAVPAPCRVDLDSLRQSMPAQQAEIASELQLERLFVDCELGAEPPIGKLYGMPTVMDESLMDQDRVTFQAGTHSDGVTMSLSDYVKLTQPRIIPIAKRS